MTDSERDTALTKMASDITMLTRITFATAAFLATISGGMILAALGEIVRQWFRP